MFWAIWDLGRWVWRLGALLVVLPLTVWSLGCMLYAWVNAWVRKQHLGFSQTHQVWHKHTLNLKPLSFCSASSQNHKQYLQQRKEIASWPDSQLCLESQMWTNNVYTVRIVGLSRCWLCAIDLKTAVIQRSYDATFCWPCNAHDALTPKKTYSAWCDAIDFVLG